MLNWCCMLFGDQHEVLNSGRLPKNVDWTPVKYGALCGALPWLVMIYELIDMPENAEIEWWVYLAVAEYFILFLTFPMNLIR